MNVAFITGSNYPNGDAQSIRVHAFAKMLCRTNQVQVYSLYANTYENHDGIYDGIKYKSLSVRKKELFKKMHSYIELSKVVENELITENSKNVIDVIVVSDLLINVLIKIISLKKKMKFKLVFDSTEWYSPSQFKMGVFSPFFIMKSIENRFLINKNLNVISISYFLHDYFTEKKVNSIRIPAVMDIKNIDYHKNINFDRIVVLYAGSQGRKDKLEFFLQSIKNHNRLFLRKIYFLGVGNLDRSYARKFKEEEFRFVGRVQRDRVIEMYRDSVFSILIRNPKSRYSRAGFPTKLVESLSTGTPVICNITSDLDKYMIDSINGFIIDKIDTQTIGNLLDKIITLSQNDIETLCKKARETAVNCFDISIYNRLVIEFFDSLV
jgi:glycosyltransferase involved in cell wall biosynthesis